MNKGVNEYSSFSDCFLKVAHDLIFLDISPVADAPSVSSLGGTFCFFHLEDSGVMKLACYVLSLALFPLSSVSLQTGIHIKLSLCFLVSQTVLTSFKICSFFILPSTSSSKIKSAASSKSVYMYRTEQSFTRSYPCYVGCTPVSSLFHFTFVKCWLLPAELTS